MFRKTYIAILFSMFFCSYVIADDKSVVISDEQLTKLMSASWKERPGSIDITCYKEITTPPKSVEEIRGQVENLFDERTETGKNLKEETEQKTKEMIEKNVANHLNAQKFPRLFKERIRISGDKQRIDKVKAEPGGKIDPNMPYNETYVNSKEPNTSKPVSFHIRHDSKVVRYDKTKWINRDPGSFALLPLGVSSLFQMGLGANSGSDKDPFYVPDPNKMEKFQKTGILLDALRVSITPDINNPGTRDRIEIKTIENKGSETILICDRKDYSYVYYSEFKIVPTGQVVYIRKCNNYDLKGFPHNVSEISYEADGQFKEKTVYTIIGVQLNPSMPDEVFEMNVPSDYGIYAAEPNNAVKVVRARGLDIDMQKILKAQKENDKETLKYFLGHESWKIRLLSLQSLNSILIKQNPHELKEAATILENDDNPKVREEAQKTLNRINHLESAEPNKK